MQTELRNKIPSETSLVKRLSILQLPLKTFVQLLRENTLKSEKIFSATFSGNRKC